MSGFPQAAFRGRPLATIGLAALAGPPLGALTLAVASLSRDVVAHDLSGEALRGALLAPVVYGLFSYVAGVIPAIAGGALFAVLDASLPPVAARGAIALAVGAASAAIWALLILSPESAGLFFRSLARFAGAGAFAGLGCFWLGRRAGLFGPVAHAEARARD